MFAMFRLMSVKPVANSGNQPAAAIAEAVAEYRTGGDVPKLLSRLRAITQSATPADLAAGVEPFRDIPEVAGPVYEVMSRSSPTMRAHS